MPRESIADRIRFARTAAGLSQSELARRCAVTRSHICAIEAGDHRPSPELVASVADSLELPLEALLDGVPFKHRRPGPHALKQHASLVRKCFSTATRRPDPVPALRVAYRLACYTAVGLRLIEQLDAQQFRPGPFWKAARQYPRRMNGPEQTVSLHLLCDDGDLQDLTPFDTGFDRSILWEPRRRWLGLVKPIDRGCYVLFPQVGVEVGAGAHRTLDYLAAVARDGARVHVDVEVDSRFHEPDKDAARDALVDMPVMRIPGHEVHWDDFPERFERSLLARLPRRDRAA